MRDLELSYHIYKLINESSQIVSVSFLVGVVRFLKTTIRSHMRMQMTYMWAVVIISCVWMEGLKEILQVTSRVGKASVYWILFIQIKHVSTQCSKA